MGLISNLSTRTASSNDRASAAIAGQPSHHHGNKRPTNEAQVSELVSAMRKVLGAAADLVDLQLQSGGEEGLTDMQLRRWLAARGWDPARAAHDLTEHAKWRAALCPGGRVLDCEVANELKQRKVLMQGEDRRGRPVLVLVGGNHVPSTDQGEVQRFFCYSADAAIALADPDLNPGGKVVFILDVGDFGWKNFDLAGAKTLFKMIHAHYVERLDTLYVHNASTVVQYLYKMVSSIIDPITRDKIVFLPNDHDAAAAILDRDIDVSMLPPNLGGSSAPRPIEDAWRAVEERRGAHRELGAAAAAAAGEAEAEAGAYEQRRGDSSPRGSESSSGSGSIPDAVVFMTQEVTGKGKMAALHLPNAAVP